MELSEVLVITEEDKQFSVREAISEIRQMAIDALTCVKRYVAGGTLVALLMWGFFQQSAGSAAWIDKAPQEVVIDNGLQQPEVRSTAYYYQYDRFAQKIGEAHIHFQFVESEHDILVVLFQCLETLDGDGAIEQVDAQFVHCYHSVAQFFTVFFKIVMGDG